MNDMETESVDPQASLDEKASHFSQAGQIHDLSLSQLRDQIKKVMIPLLIKTFQFKQELNQSLSPPSRLQSQKSQPSSEEITDQLNTLDNDLKVLLLWCQSCRNQIQKALIVREEEKKSTVSLEADSYPAISKSFSEAVSAQTSLFQTPPPSQEEDQPLSEPSPAPPVQKSWWKKWLRK